MKIAHPLALCIAAALIAFGAGAVASGQQPATPVEGVVHIAPSVENAAWRLTRRHGGHAAAAEWRPPYSPMEAAVPLGASLGGIMSTQVMNGQAALMTLHQVDFLPGDPRLNRRGLRKLQRIVQRMSWVPFPIVIQPTPGFAGLDEQRRIVVMEHLATCGIVVSEEQLIIGESMSRGLDAPDAEILSQKLNGLTAGGTTAGGAPPAAQGVLIPAP